MLTKVIIHLSSVLKEMKAFLEKNNLSKAIISSFKISILVCHTKIYKTQSVAPYPERLAIPHDATNRRKTGRVPASSAAFIDYPSVHKSRHGFS